MKIFIILALTILTAHAQRSPRLGGYYLETNPYAVNPYPGYYFPTPGDYPFPGSSFPRFPNDFCSYEKQKEMMKKVEDVCLEKLADFSADHLVECSLKSTYLSGCKARCYADQKLYAKVRIDVNSDCRYQTASLRKTVIKYYR